MRCGGGGGTCAPSLVMPATLQGPGKAETIEGHPKAAEQLPATRALELSQIAAPRSHGTSNKSE